MKLLKLTGTEGNPIIMDAGLFCAATTRENHTVVMYGDENSIEVKDSIYSISEQLESIENDQNYDYEKGNNFTI